MGLPMAVVQAFSRPVHARESLAKNAQLAQRQHHNIPSQCPTHASIDRPMSNLAAHGRCPSFLLQRMPNNKPKGSPSQAARSAAMPAHCQPTRLAYLAMHTAMFAHCQPTSSAIPALFPANMYINVRLFPAKMRSNACLLPSNTLDNALPISNRHAQICMPTAHHTRGNASSAMLFWSANSRKQQCLAVAEQHARQCLPIAYQCAPMPAQF